MATYTLITTKRGVLHRHRNYWILDYDGNQVSRHRWGSHEEAITWMNRYLHNNKLINNLA